MRAVIQRGGPKWELERLVDRPPLVHHRVSAGLLKDLEKTASTWELPLKATSSVWASAAGLVPEGIPCLCGLGPVARDLGTPQEAVNRTSLIQRTLLLAQYLLAMAPEQPA